MIHFFAMLTFTFRNQLRWMRYQLVQIHTLFAICRCNLYTRISTATTTAATAERRHPARLCVSPFAVLSASASSLSHCTHCPLSGVILYDQLSIWRSLRLKINMAKAAISTDCYRYCYGYWYWVLDGFGIGIRIASAQCNFVVLATKTGRKKDQERKREGQRVRNQAKRRAVSAIDMLDRQRTTRDEWTNGQANLQSGFRYALSGIRNRIRLRIRLSKPIVGPCKCQACVSFHMPAASYLLSPPLSHTASLSFSLSVCFMPYELHKFPGSVFMDLFLFIIMLCVWRVYEYVCDVRVCGVCAWCVCECFCVWLCRYNIIIKRIAKVCP